MNQKLQKSYPFKKEKCKNSYCFVCVSGEKGNCMKENVNYEVECIRDECKYVYIGETARNAFCRGREHLKGISKKDKDSVFVDHIMKEHESDFDFDQCGGFKMNVRETHKSAMERLITEAVKIETSEKPTLNLRTGYRANNVLRLRPNYGSNIEF